MINMLKMRIKCGFQVLSISKAVKYSKIIFVLLPDAVQNDIIKKIFPNSNPGSTIIFAHGYWLRFESKNIPKHFSILMIAPDFQVDKFETNICNLLVYQHLLILFKILMEKQKNM